MNMFERLRGHFQTSVILHEVLHALGAWHEQERPDRQGNINVLFENIAPYAVGNFEWQHTHEFGPYDLGSVLQYGLSVRNIHTHLDSPVRNSADTYFFFTSKTFSCLISMLKKNCKSLYICYIFLKS